jgi:hypothetical protein
MGWICYPRYKKHYGTFHPKILIIYQLFNSLSKNKITEGDEIKDSSRMNAMWVR